MSARGTLIICRGEFIGTGLPSGRFESRALCWAQLSVHDGSRRMFETSSFPDLVGALGERRVLCLGVARIRELDQLREQPEQLPGRVSAGLLEVAPREPLADHHRRTGC